MNFCGKKILPGVIFTLLAITFYGQKRNEETFDILRAKPFNISLDISKKDKLQASGFNKILFIDSRVDTSLMGYVTIDTKEGLRRITFSENANTYLNAKLNKLISPGFKETTLVIVLNDFWFNETTTQAGWLEGTLLGNEKLISTCFINIQYFIRNEQTVKKIGTLDTTFIKKGWLPNNCNDLLEKAFKQAILYGQMNGDDSIAKSTIITNKEFDSLIASNSTAPILKSARLEKGIYFSFNDFLNNTPVNMPFEIKELSRSFKIKYKLPAGTVGDKAWGVCDGENIYMHLDSNYYKMERKNNSFEVSAPETIEIINTFSQRAVHTAMWYFAYENPFKIFALEPFLGPGNEKHFRYRRYYLNILDGSLR